MLSQGDRRTAAIIKKKLSPEKRYRLSAYTFSLSENGEHLLRNTLTGMTVSLSREEWAIVQSAGQESAAGARLAEAGLEELVRNCFLIEEDTGAYQLYELARTVLKTMSPEGPGTKSYTILPTTGCNARCVYCYEQGMTAVSMSEETADHTADFIERTRRQDTVHLLWFGGEPLAGSRIISRICRRLEEKGIPFRSEIVTNATLLTPELLEEALSLWRLEKAQVSVDGARQDYEARKQYADPGVHHYDAMMDAVDRLLQHGVRVRLRCNYDAGNLDGLKSFFDEIKERFGAADNLSVYPAMLFQAQAEESGPELYRKIQPLIAYLRELGLRKESEGPFRLKLNLCGADSGDKCVVIAPDGKLYHCEHLPGNTAFGSIFDSQAAVCGDARAQLPPDSACVNCCFLPICTPFFKNGCADYFEHCREFRQTDMEEALRRLR